jgi:hypothetical protein
MKKEKAVLHNTHIPAQGTAPRTAAVKAPLLPLLHIQEPFVLPVVPNPQL